MGIFKECRRSILQRKREKASRKGIAETRLHLDCLDRYLEQAAGCAPDRSALTGVNRIRAMSDVCRNRLEQITDALNRKEYARADCLAKSLTHLHTALAEAAKGIGSSEPERTAEGCMGKP